MAGNSADDGQTRLVATATSRRWLVLPVAAAVIIAVCTWKLLQEPVRRGPAETVRQSGSPPSFELYDQNSRLVRLNTWLHRHPIVVVFFDGADGATKDPWLTMLRENYAAVKSTGTIVIGISDALPQQNRAGQAVQFPLLTDVNPDKADSLHQVHRSWGRFDEANLQTLTGVFVINRAGLVTWEDGRPAPVESPEPLIRALTRGEIPGALK